MFTPETYVICLTGQGQVVRNGTISPLPTHFPKNSVAQAKGSLPGQSGKTHVYVIGRNEEFLIDSTGLKKVDVEKTGKGHSRKICNRCFVLKLQEKFETNQTDAKGNKTSRPTCRECRRDIDKRPATGKALAKLKQGAPAKGTLWQCPICEKRNIVGVTAKVVIDHDHDEGRPRGYLCDSCNTGLGRFKNGKDYLRNAITYLEHYEKKPPKKHP